MKRLVFLFSFLAVFCLILGPIAMAQEDTKDTFTLEEITVTAEKRSENLQKLPSSVSALPGTDLVAQSKITTREILESVPNVTFREGYGTNPDGNIAIRGIQRTQESKGINEVLPSTTAVYVDGIYQGIGGHYDVNRVEVLRGPQGTLYGRSATGGVISFYTNDPKLKELGGYVTAEVGTDALINVQGALNIPVGEKVAIRVAGRRYQRDGFFTAGNKQSGQGGRDTTTEGRIKVLFKPSDAFDIVLHASKQVSYEWGGGYLAGLTGGPNNIDYEVSYGQPEQGPPLEYNQYGFTANYDFGHSVLTWIGGYHDYDYTGVGPKHVGPDGEIDRSDNNFPTDWHLTQEVRLASNTEGRLTWLVGANYFEQKYENDRKTYYLYEPPNVDPALPEGLTTPTGTVFRWAAGTFKNYGIFTEETFELRDDLRITAGLRYDYTDFTQSMIFKENFASTHYANWVYPAPEDWVVGTLLDDNKKWHNLTYKLRLEYDVTPENMVYFTTATGFLPGYASVGPDINHDTESISFSVRVLDEQKLTSYEIGTKNQFLDNRLRVNAALFHYHLEGYPEALSLNDMPFGNYFAVLALPVNVIGAEVESEYMITMNDKISFNAGYQRPEVEKYPEALIWRSGTVRSGDSAAMLKVQPGNPEFEADLAYDHNFDLTDGSTLVPRVELHYTSAYYMTQLNYMQVDNGLKPYDHQDAVTLCNANLTWTSASQKYSVTGWVRNAFDEEYKAFLKDVAFARDLSNPISVTPGDPRTFGLIVNVKF